MESDIVIIASRMVLAVVAGGLIGTEHSIHGRAAGFRTHTLVYAASAFFLIFSMVVVLYACSKGDGELKHGFDSGRYRTIVVFGDSIVEGYGQPEGWPEKLGRDLAGKYKDVHVINAGASGDTAADGLARIKNDVLDQNPDMVLIAFGLNDMKNVYPFRITRPIFQLLSWKFR